MYNSKSVVSTLVAVGMLSNTLVPTHNSSQTPIIATSSPASLSRVLSELVVPSPQMETAGFAPATFCLQPFYRIRFLNYDSKNQGFP